MLVLGPVPLIATIMGVILYIRKFNNGFGKKTVHTNAGDMFGVLCTASFFSLAVIFLLGYSGPILEHKPAFFPVMLSVLVVNIILISLLELALFYRRQNPPLYFATKRQSQSRTKSASLIVIACGISLVVASLFIFKLLDAHLTLSEPKLDYRGQVVGALLGNLKYYFGLAWATGFVLGLLAYSSVCILINITVGYNSSS